MSIVISVPRTFLPLLLLRLFVLSVIRALLQLVCLCVLVAAGLPSSAAGPGDWWTFHHDLSHTGRSPFAGAASPTQKWAFTTHGGIGYSSPALAEDGTIYIGSDDDNLYALNPDGSKKWAFATGSSVFSSPAIGADGTIYIGSYDDKLYAINPDGSQRWTFPTGGFVASSPAIGTDGTIYVGSEDAHLYAINPDGSKKWAFATGDGIISSPAIGADGTIYVGSDDENLYAINPDGSQQWAFLTGGFVVSSPAIGTDGTIYVGSTDNNIYALNPANGSLKWEYATGDEIYSSPALGTDGTVYVGSLDGNLYAINLDGALEWQFPTDNSIYSSPAIDVDGTIYVGSFDDNLYAINTDGLQQWAYPTGSTIISSPAIGADGTIYVGSWDSKVYAIGPGPAMYTITPTAGANGSISPNTVQTVISGNSLSLTATPTTGYTVSTWSVDGTEVQFGGTTYTLTDITASHTVLVTFTLQTFTVTASAGANGQVTPTAPPAVNYGDSLTFTAIPTTGYGVNVWTLDGAPVQTGGSSYTLSNITANHTVEVTFSLLTFTVTASAGANGQVTPTAPSTVNYGGSLTFTAMPNSGYAVDSWSVDSIVQQTGGTTFILTNITANHTVQVLFFTLTFTATPTSPQLVNTSITLTVATTGTTPEEYEFRAGYSGSAGTQWSYLTGYTTITTCTWTPAKAGAYTLVVYARAVGHTNSFDTYATLNFRVLNPPVTAVTLNASPPSPALVNTPITLTAVASGGSQPQYEFRVYYTDAAGTQWSTLSAYSSTASCTWTPATASAYTLVVYARSDGNTDSFDVYTTLNFEVLNPPVTAVTLSANPLSPALVNTPIMLTAVANGGSQPQYEFRLYYTDATGSHMDYLTGYTNSATCTWTPTTANTYTLVVYARSGGNTDSFDVYTTLNFEVLNPPVTAVTLRASSPSPVLMNTPVTLTAVASGGSQPQYEFRLYYTDAAGLHTDYLSGYTTSATCIWTPTTVGTYLLVVYARSGGNTDSFEVYTTLNFQVLQSFTVTPSTDGNGTINPDTAQTAKSGSNLTFTATPNTGYLVNSWLVNGTVAQTGGTTFTLSDITAAAGLEVTFTLQSFTVTPSTDGNGTINPNTAQTATYGSGLTFTATPNTGYQVNTWLVNGTVAQTGGTTFTLTDITAAAGVEVTFTLLSFTVTPSTDGNGTINPSTAQTATYGSNLTFTATPNTGYLVNTWLVNGTVAQSGGTTFTLTDITAAAGVEVTFTLQSFIVTASAGANGQVAPTAPPPVTYGGSLTFTATPNSGYGVNVWTLDGVPVQTGGSSYTLSNITANHTVQVSFSILTFTVTASAGANGQVTPTAPPAVNYGGSLTFTATLSAGSLVNTWSVDGTVVQTGGTTYTLTDITANHTVQVLFFTFTLIATPALPQLVNTPITLTVVTNSTLPEVYEFRAGYLGSTGTMWNYLTGYTSATSCNWTPTMAGAYTLVVYARAVGNTDSFDVYATLNFQVNTALIPPVTTVTLNANPPSSVLVNTPITLTAVASGGSQPQYEFRAYYTTAAGLQTDYLSAYSSTATCTWTPALAGVYTLVVYARSGGNTNSFDVYQTLNYTITQL